MDKKTLDLLIQKRTELAVLESEFEYKYRLIAKDYVKQIDEKKKEIMDLLVEKDEKDGSELQKVQ